VQTLAVARSMQRRNLGGVLLLCLLAIPGSLVVHFRYTRRATTRNQGPPDRASGNILAASNGFRSQQRRTASIPTATATQAVLDQLIQVRANRNDEEEEEEEGTEDEEGETSDNDGERHKEQQPQQAPQRQFQQQPKPQQQQQQPPPLPPPPQQQQQKHRQREVVPVGLHKEQRDWQASGVKISQLPTPPPAAPTAKVTDPLIAITVSDGAYDDILPYTIKANENKIDIWYILRDKNKSPPFKLTSQKVQILTYDFHPKCKPREYCPDKWNGHKAFDKYGGIRFAQQYADAHHTKPYRIMLLDSDIVLGDSGVPTLDNLENNKLYRPSIRYDYKRASDWQQKKNGQLSRQTQFCLGYVQLYAVRAEMGALKLTRADLGNAAEGDFSFKNLFRLCQTVPKWQCSHLGQSGLHWDGRTDHSDFVADVPP
jgi:hypothetical protein